MINAVELPKSLWLSSDKIQFDWLNQHVGGKIVGTTWHHTAIPGVMERVPFGIHNVTAVGDQLDFGLTVRDKKCEGKMIMKIDESTIALPVPNDEQFSREERIWRLELPVEYKQFLSLYNGGVPITGEFTVNNHKYLIERFLGIIKPIREHELGMYDIDVILTQLDDRLYTDESILGVELLPIATLFAGDFVVLNFKNGSKMPNVEIWLHEESMELEAKTIPAFKSFAELLDNLSE
ncbi:SMI1/KNR4 family protein [Periweissella cryptocerci]|uniref:SMI1/KNR4 family protein n=1 Tax=Periweissella cryptocerci TaxID=2506420 RepID=A0A4P6YSU0_9LACO|nr:SMI1/KNR4 family protein [Periweissella cryptocerci]QBO35726.1 SMI1/KNR4 family protein [Periweissella cryptocerci]